MMLFYIFLAFFVVSFIPIFLSLRTMRALVAYSNSHVIPIFGRCYSSELHLHSDPWFHWQMLKGTGLASVHDVNMLALIRRLRSSLLISYLTGAVIVVGFATLMMLGGNP